MFYITPLNDGKWHHLCLTLQASSGRQELFLDGESGILFIYLFIYYFPTIKITQALHYTKMWRGDLRKPQGLYEEAPSLQ